MEASLKLEELPQAVRLAEQSLAAFRQYGDTRGQADAARLLTTAMIHQDRRKEADRLLKDELAVFQTSASYGSKSAEARLLLALADVNSDRRGQKKREEALRFVGQARTLALDEADLGVQASSLAVMSKIFIKYKGDQKACNKEALRLGTQALQVFQQLDDARGSALASHHCSIAQGNLSEMAASLKYISESVAYWRKAEDLLMEANGQLMMGQLLLKCGAVSHAVTAAETVGTSQMLEINVALPNGHAELLTLLPSSTIQDVRTKAQLAFGKKHLRLITAKNRVLVDFEQTLEEAKIEDGECLTALVLQPQLAATHGAFALWCCGESAVVTWGNDRCGSDSLGVRDQLRGVQQIQATGTAFAAILADGSVVTWGDPRYGGSSAAVRDQLKGVQQIQAAREAFAAILGDGSVVTWGNAVAGADSSAVQDQLKGVQQIQAAQMAFAAILEDGSVVTWGHADCGGDSSAVQDQLRGVQQIQAAQMAFAAIVEDGSVVTWGHAGFGGDSDSNHESGGGESLSDVLVSSDGSEALAAYRQCNITGSRELRAVQLAVRAHINNGEPWRAIWTAENAVSRYRELRDRSNEAQALICLASGYTYSPSGREEQEAPANMQTKMKPPPKEAVDTLQRALHIAHELKDSVLEAQVMSHLANLHVKRTEMDEAIFAAHDALSHREVKDVEGKGMAFQSLTSAHLHNKDFADAERAARAQRDFSRKEGHWSGDANGQLSMAEVLCAEQKFEEAVEKAKDAQAMFAEHKDRRGEARALLQVSRARLGAEEYEKALHVAERSHELFLRVNDLLGKSEALQVMAECRSKLLAKQQQQSTMKLRGTRKGNAKAPLPWEDLSRAASVSKQAKEAAKAVGDVQAEAAALCTIAQIHIFNGRPDVEILEALDDAMALAVEAGDTKTEAIALSLKAEVHLQAEQLQDALDAARQAELLLKGSQHDTAKAKIEEILNKLRTHEFRVDEAPQVGRGGYGGYAFDPRLAAPLVAGPDPEMVRKTIQEVTKKMVGKEDDLEADLPLMDLGAKRGWKRSGAGGFFVVSKVSN
eukprot:symbB.v1.2.014480.t1/scaffold1060.1/size140514/3